MTFVTVNETRGERVLTMRVLLHHVDSSSDLKHAEINISMLSIVSFYATLIQILASNDPQEIGKSRFKK